MRNHEEHSGEIEALRKEYEKLKYTDPQERREFPRVRAAIPLLFRNEAIDSFPFMVDIGGGGVRITYPEALGEEEQTFSLLLEELCLQVEGKVVWQRKTGSKYEIGIIFTQIEEAERRKIVGWVQERLSSEEKEEKRKFLRIPRLLTASVWRGDDRKDQVSGMIADLSLGGARLLTSTELPEGSCIEMMVELQEGSDLRLTGEVVWTNQVEAFKTLPCSVKFIQGIKFQKVPQDMVNLLEDYVDFRSKLAETNLVQLLLNLK